jgi:hypothetical protein
MGIRDDGERLSWLLPGLRRRQRPGGIKRASQRISSLARISFRSRQDTVATLGPLHPEGVAAPCHQRELVGTGVSMNRSPERGDRGKAPAVCAVLATAESLKARPPRANARGKVLSPLRGGRGRVPTPQSQHPSRLPAGSGVEGSEYDNLAVLIRREVEP